MVIIDHVTSLGAEKRNFEGEEVGFVTSLELQSMLYYPLFAFVRVVIGSKSFRSCTQFTHARCFQYANQLCFH